MRHSIPAAFYRAGTSKGLFLSAEDVPILRADWAPLFLKALGSPDSHGRQLNGMGGGEAALSKVAVVGPASVAGGDVDYTFAQVAVERAVVDFRGTCGNMLAAVGPFAVEAGFVRRSDGPVSVHIHNCNTGKRVIAHFQLQHGVAVETGDLVIPGIGGSGAPIRLDFLDPGGAVTGRLLPTRKAREELEVPGHGRIEASLIDAGNACVLLRAEDLGYTGTELPEALERDEALMRRLIATRAAAAALMKIPVDPFQPQAEITLPYVVLLAPTQPAVMVGGGLLAAKAADFTARVLAGNRIHRAVPLTVGLCLAAAARIVDTLPQALCPRIEGLTRIAMPTGVLNVDAELTLVNGRPRVVRGSLFRTARRLMDGRVYV